MQSPPGYDPIRDPNCLPSVLTSDIYNEAEHIFTLLENKDRKTVSYLDVLTLLRGMGMNPLTTDMHYLRDVMAEPVEKLSAAYREEEARKEKERKKEEDKKKKDFRKPNTTNTSASKKDPRGLTRGRSGNGKDSSDNGSNNNNTLKKKVLNEPQEEIKNIDWNIFITAVEPIFRDNIQEQSQILAALRVLDVDNKGKMTRKELIDIVTREGESILSPPEVLMLNSLIPEEFGFLELAQRIQGTYIPPTPEEIAAAEETIRLEREKRMAMELNNNNNNNGLEDIASLLGTSNINSNVNVNNDNNNNNINNNDSPQSLSASQQRVSVAGVSNEGSNSITAV